MTYLRAAALTILACIAVAGAEDLTGLWKAKGRFGPDARGPLVIQKEGAAYSADMLGRRVSVQEFASGGAGVHQFVWLLEGRESRVADKIVSASWISFADLPALFVHSS